MEISRRHHAHQGPRPPKIDPSKEQSSAPRDTFQEDNRSLFRKVLGKLFPKQQAPPERQWTVLYYGAGNNNLSRDLSMELSALAGVGSSDDVQVVAQLARSGEDGQMVRGVVNKIPFKRFASARSGVETVETILGDMGDAKSYRDFLEWGMKEYPSKYTMVIQSGHGLGHRGSMSDDTSGSLMTVPEQGDSLEALPQSVNVFLKESCMGASLEEAYELKDHVHYMAASQDLTKGNVDLPKFLDSARQIAREEELTPEAVVQLLANSKSRMASTFSIVDLSKMDSIAEATKEFESSLKASGENLASVAASTPGVLPDQAALNSENVVTRVMEEKRAQYRDAIGFLDRVASTSGPSADEARALASELRGAVIHQHASPEYGEQNGLSWNLSPDPSIGPGQGYKDLALSRDTGWDGVVGNKEVG